MEIDLVRYQVPLGDCRFEGGFSSHPLFLRKRREVGAKREGTGEDGRARAGTRRPSFFCRPPYLLIRAGGVLDRLPSKSWDGILLSFFSGSVESMGVAGYPALFWLQYV